MNKNEENDILKQAILDAKKVKEIATETAKMQLEEQFRPRLQSIISNKIREEAGEDLEDENEDGIEQEPVEGEGTTEVEEVPESPEAPVDEPVDAPIEDDDIDDGVKLKFEEEPGVEKIEDVPPGTDITIEVPEEDEEIDFELEPDEEEVTEEGVKCEETEDEEELNIESIIAELENEMEDEPVEDQEIDIEVEDDLDEDINLDIEDDEDGEEEEIKEQLETITKEHNELKEQHTKAMNVVKYLRSKLNEINLANSKLLYTNKLFKNYSLDGTSKMKIVESLDRAQSIREAELIYTTLTESITANAVKRQSTKLVKTITENMASNKTASTKPSKKIINESNDVVTRFQKLAGIILPSEE